MLPRIFLLFMQILSALYFTPLVMKLIGIRNNEILHFAIMAVVIALIIWLAGQVGGVVLKEVKPPSPATLTAALVGALIGAAIILFLPIIPQFITKYTTIPLNKVADFYYPLAGALIGYFYQK